MDRVQHRKLSALIDDGYLARDLTPLKCTKCESTDTRETVQGFDGGHVSSKLSHCKDCGTVLGYWDTGYWQI
jgi:hypothetical protein